jgi:hypothetical protein
MAQPTAANDAGTALNSMVTDSVTQAGTEVPSLAPANAGGNYYQGNSQALGLAALNATNAQQQNTINLQASTPVGITTLYSINTATDSPGTSDILDQAPRHRPRRIARVKFLRK